MIHPPRWARFLLGLAAIALFWVLANLFEAIALNLPTPTRRWPLRFFLLGDVSSVLTGLAPLYLWVIDPLIGRIRRCLPARLVDPYVEPLESHYRP